MRDPNTCAVGGEPLPVEGTIFRDKNGARCAAHDRLVSIGELEVARLRDQANGIVQQEVQDD